MSTIINDDLPPPALPTVAELAVGDGFLWDGGKLHEKWSDTKVVCHNNKAELAVADFGTNGVLKRNIAVHHTAA